MNSNNSIWKTEMHHNLSNKSFNKQSNSGNHPKFLEVETLAATNNQTFTYKFPSIKVDIYKIEYHRKNLTS